MSKYAAKFLQPGEEPPNGWAQVFNNQGSWSIAVDTTGIASPADYPFVPGVDDSYALNSYIIISDTTTTSLTGRTTGNSTGVANPDTPTYWVSSKSYDDFLYLANRLPGREGQTPFSSGISAINWITNNGYWCSYNESLILDVDANNNLSYNGSGNIWYDLSFNQNDAIITNATFTTINNQINTGTLKTFNFDGNGDYISIGQPISSNSGYSIFAWVYTNTTIGSLNIVSSENSPFWIANGTLYAGVGGNYMVVSYGPFPVGIWKHVAVTFHMSGMMTLYVDGTQVSQNTNASLNYTSENTFIGSHFYGGGNTSFWNGYISQVKIFNNEQKEFQVKEHFEVTRSLFGI